MEPGDILENPADYTAEAVILAEWRREWPYSVLAGLGTGAAVSCAVADYIERVALAYPEPVPDGQFCLELESVVATTRWLVESVRWTWTEGHLEVKGATFVRHRPRSLS